MSSPIGRGEVAGVKRPHQVVCNSWLRDVCVMWKSCECQRDEDDMPYEVDISHLLQRDDRHGHLYSWIHLKCKGCGYCVAWFLFDDKPKNYLDIEEFGAENYQNSLKQRLDQRYVQGKYKVCGADVGSKEALCYLVYCDLLDIIDGIPILEDVD